MKHPKWQIWFGLTLVALSAALYGLHYLIFHDAHHIFIYMVGDIAFVPVEVLLVSLVIHQLLARREKRALLNKMNMVIGAFFSAVGNELLRSLARRDRQRDEVAAALHIDKEWTTAQFDRVKAQLRGRDWPLDISADDLEQLRDFLVEQRPFIVGLLQNPNLLEHDKFTDLLWAVLHLAEELAHRDRLRDLPQDDIDHLVGDIRRAYSQLATQWVIYLQHLQQDYPYLFSLAVRTNPFQGDTNVVIGAVTAPPPTATMAAPPSRTPRQQRV